MSYVESEHFVGKIAQKAIIEKDGKILLCKGIGDEVWEFPGGRLHDGEDPVEGLRREIREELGIGIRVIGPVFVTRSYHRKSKSWQVFIAYACTMNDDSVLVPDRREVQDLHWVDKKVFDMYPMFEDCEAARKVYLEIM